MEPQVTFVSLPRRTLKTPDDVSQWVSDVQQQLLHALQKGPVGIQ
jgi:hypothetical protein